MTLEFQVSSGAAGWVRGGIPGPHREFVLAFRPKNRDVPQRPDPMPLLSLVAWIQSCLPLGETPNATAALSPVLRSS